MPAPSLVSLPNALSLVRFPLAVGFLVSDGTATRVVLLGMASASDLLDGWLARRRSGVTRWGALLDPIADKTFVVAAMLSFARSGELSPRGLLILLSRDIAIVLGFVATRLAPSLRGVTVRARLPGKIVTALQLGVLLALLLVPEQLRVLLPIVAVASAVAIVDYGLLLAREHRAASLGGGAIAPGDRR